VWALDFESVRDISLAVVGGAVLMAVVLAWLAKAVVSKLIAIAVFAGLGALVWWERHDVQTCADQVLDTLSAGAVDDATCRFFGHDVTVSSPIG
jgi:hypothetical protein